MTRPNVGAVIVCGAAVATVVIASNAHVMVKALTGMMIQSSASASTSLVAVRCFHQMQAT
jgi:hypothetical protein